MRQWKQKPAFLLESNLGAEKAEDLAFRELEFAPEPAPDDGLA